METQFPELLAALQACPAHKRGEPPVVPRLTGVYLFTEGSQARYVGRTRDFNRRLGQHTAPKSTHRQSAYAFKIAKEEARNAGISVIGTRREIAVEPGFDAIFSAAKKRVRRMEFRFVEVNEPRVSAVFEVYASIVLGTDVDVNDWETS